MSYDPLDRLYDYVGTYAGRYLYDGAETVGFATSGTTINTRFIRGPGTDEIVASYIATGPVPAQYWASDERGSLVNLSNGATGASTVVNTYDDYGQPAPTNLGRLQYTGQLWMPDFGAYHYKARAYQPGLGRFLQTDPVGYEAGLNLYAYVGNDPVNMVDPTGAIAECQVCKRTVEAFNEGADAFTDAAMEASRQFTDFTVAAGDAIGQAAAEPGYAVSRLAKGEGTAMDAVTVALTMVPVAGLADDALRVTTGASRTVVIGEDMAGRVVPYARQTGAAYYRPGPRVGFAEDLAANRSWLQQQMRSGNRIIDIGPAPGRTNYPGATSPFYQMERNQVSGYRNYSRSKQ